eukprot:scaffold8136_cov127-Cylindrotheca_fusiformis.AAC.19
MKPFLVGGPLLGSTTQNQPTNLASRTCFEPIVTPEITLDKHHQQQQPQRFILLPHDRYISVLAYNTGSCIASLVPLQDGEGDDDGDDDDTKVDKLIECVCLAKESRTEGTTVQDILNDDDTMDVDDNDAEENQGSLSAVEQTVEEIIVMVGCKDGTIREFNLQALGSLDKSAPVNCGPYVLSGPCFRPRRVIKVSKTEPIMYLTVPLLSSPNEEGILTYVVTRTKNVDQAALEEKKNGVSNVNVAVLRVLIPHFDGKEKTVSMLSKSDDGVQRKQPIDNIKCRVGKDKSKVFLNTAPFRMLSVSRPTKKNSTTTPGEAFFVILARANSIHVYYEQVQSPRRFAPMSFPIPTANPLTAISVSRNNTDIACGHQHGDIKVWNNILDTLESYHVTMAANEQQFGREMARSSTNKPKDPRKDLIISKVHWHSHPVASMVHDSGSSPMDPILYSGGEESVLVTWQNSRGTDRPVDVLPRIALGGIVHIACSDKTDTNPPHSILVYCEDNSLQLFQSHNKGRKWKLQGLACKSKEEDQLANSTSIAQDPRAFNSKDSPLVIVGLPEAPGLMQWYHPSKQRLVGSLEVAPFNRISRAEEDESPLPTPSITGHAFDENGRQLITLEETPSENIYVGAYERRNTEEHGIVSTIRFWSGTESTSTNNHSSYVLSAAMTYPHGPKNRVSALGMAKNGSIACTVSNDENAFRIWQKVVGGEDDQIKSSPSWTCRYKVTVPAGFSHLSTCRDGVAFSDDGSIVAIGFGNMVTLWDSEEARFLTTLRHLEDLKCNIDSVQFVKPGKLQDLLLIKSASGVSLQSPFKQNGSFRNWSWGIPEAAKGFTVTDSELIPNIECVAIAVFDSTKDQSRLLFIDAISGVPGVKTAASENTNIISGIEGCIRSICAISSSDMAATRDGSTAQPLSLFALTSSGELLNFTDTAEIDSLISSIGTEKATSDGPRLDIERGAVSKRRRVHSEAISSTDSISTKTASDVFGLSLMDESKSAPPLTAELPSLSSAFVRAFVGRRLARREESD